MIDEFMELINGVIDETGRTIGLSKDQLKIEAANQLGMLALAVGEPGYDRAVLASRDNMALSMGLAAVGEADAVDARILGVLQGGLFLAAKGGAA